MGAGDPARAGGAFVVALADLDGTQVALAGGKGASLGALARIEGVRVPAGFVVTTDALRRTLANAPEVEGLLARLGQAGPADLQATAELGAALRRTIETTVIPADVASAITGAVERRGAEVAWAVRSSATAEDSPTTSFAGQHDSFLGVTGAWAVLEHVRRCWASLFTERAVAYRQQSGARPGDAAMAVVVQELVPAVAAGVLFTADPLTGNRRVSSVEAVAGLGEALVAGQVNPEVWTVREGQVTARPGTPDPVLTTDRVVALADLGRRVEAAAGAPQDIEWCLDAGGFALVQARPITTLFPIPPAADERPHVYVSVGHQQMMTDALRPLGLTLWQRLALAPMHAAGSRLFVDIAPALGSEAGRARLRTLSTSDPLTGDALASVIERGFVPPAPAGAPVPGPPAGAPEVAPELDPSMIGELVSHSEAAVARLQGTLAQLTGTAALDAIAADLEDLKATLTDARSTPMVMAGMDASAWLNEHLEAWLGDRNAADVLTQSVPGNVTSEMGLALLDVADAIRPHPAVVRVLGRATGDGFLGELDHVDGGPQARAAIEGFLAVHGVRCVGEIDVTRTRWSEHPFALVPVLLGNVRNFEAGAGRRRFEAGAAEAQAAERDVLDRLRALPDGAAKAAQAARQIGLVRTYSGFREYPKFHIICRLAVYRRALLAEAAALVRAGQLGTVEDAYFLTFDELRDAVRTGVVAAGVVDGARRAFAAHERLSPPRVMTSEGEVFNGAYRRTDAPAGALLGLAVSAGTVEGPARVITDLADAATLRPGDVLVTRFTDPSWSPAFVAVAGLVTEIGGLMSHGAVITREYGLPAVVGVEHATQRIRDGQRVRVHGTQGYVELLS